MYALPLSHTTALKRSERTPKRNLSVWLGRRARERIVRKMWTVMRRMMFDWNIIVDLVHSKIHSM
jgi:hypothetical protein